MVKTRRQRDAAGEPGVADLAAMFATMSQTLVALKSKVDSLQSPADTQSQDTESTSGPRGAPTTGTLLPLPMQLPAPVMRRFADNGALHPMEFLKQIEKYSSQCNLTDQVKIDMAVNHLDGSTQVWASALSDLWETWDDFRQAFISMYWSPERQDNIIAEFSTTKYSSVTHLSMAQFLLQWMGKVKFLTPPIEPAKFLRQFMHLLPANTFNILTASNIRTTTELLQVLQRMDEGATRRGTRQSVVESSNRQPTQQQGYNNHPKQFNQPQTNATTSRGVTNAGINSNNRTNNNNSNSNWRSKHTDETRARVQQIGVQNADEDPEVPRGNDDDHETSGNEY